MMKLWKIRAKYYWGIDSEPVENASLIVGDSPHAAMEDEPFLEAAAMEEVIDLGEVCIVPGMINMHTHLEFSDVDGPIDATGGILPWLGRVIEHRARQTQSAGEPSEPSEPSDTSRHAAIRRGALQAWLTGTIRFIDNVTEPWSRSWVEGPCDTHRSRRQAQYLSEAILPAFEVIGRNDERWERSLQFAAAHAAHGRTQDDVQVAAMGVAPHAPYSTPLRAVQKAVEFAHTQRALVSMHLAESIEEREWIDEGRGPMCAWLQQFDSSHEFGTRYKMTDYLEVLSRSPRALIVHGNYLVPEEIGLIAQHRSHMAVVYCPRTHHHFGHATHPWQTMQDAGISVFLGTDSLASNPDLNLLEEARFVARTLSNIHPRTLLAMLMTEPRRFLGMKPIDASKTGACPITVSDLAAFRLTPGARTSLVEQLVYGDVELQPLSAVLLST